jgi:trk system potassium uptake protein TrkH
MMHFWQKVPFLLELFFNGTFILLYSLVESKKLPGIIPEDLAFKALDVGVWFVPVILLIVVIANYLSLRSLEEFVRKHVFSIVILIPMLITAGEQQFAFWLSCVHLISSVLTLYDKGDTKLSERSALTIMEKLQLKPAQFVILSFGVLIFLGAFQ